MQFCSGNLQPVPPRHWVTQSQTVGLSITFVLKSFIVILPCYDEIKMIICSLHNLAVTDLASRRWGERLTDGIQTKRWMLLFLRALKIVSRSICLQTNAKYWIRSCYPVFYSLYLILLIAVNGFYVLTYRQETTQSPTHSFVCRRSTDKRQQIIALNNRRQPGRMREWCGFSNRSLHV